MGNTFKFLLEYKEYIDNIQDINNSKEDNYIYNEILKRTKFGKLAIVEGLIHTHPIDKSINVLRKRFPELNIEKEETGEIYIESTLKYPQKLENYITIITNLGYFISKYSVDGEEWLKSYDNDTCPIAFILEPKYDYLVDIPNVLYHASPIRFKHKILKYGLTPKSGNKLSNHPNRIYLTGSIDKAIKFGEYLKSEVNNEFYENGYCIYKVNGSGLSKLYSDINFRVGGYYTVDNINIEYIKLIEK